MTYVLKTQRATCLRILRAPLVELSLDFALARLQDIRCPVLLVASLFLVVRPGAPSSVLAPSSDALCS